MGEVGTGDKVKVSGTVAVLPNVLGPIFYISDQLMGSDIYELLEFPIASWRLVE